MIRVAHLTDLHLLALDGVPALTQYTVSVAAAPQHHRCEVVAGESGLADGDRDGVDVRCERATYTIGGTLEGFAVDDRIVLSLDGVEVKVESINWPATKPATLVLKAQLRAHDAAKPERPSSASAPTPG